MNGFEGTTEARQQTDEEATSAKPGRTSSGKALRDSLRILLIALIAALAIRTFVFEGFQIPSESMANTLLVGDFVFVSKLHYGPRLPMTIGLPLTDWYAENLELPYVRLPGFSAMRRGDVIVFNHPPEAGPIERRAHYIKRVVALPGDSVALQDKQLVVNGVAQPLLPTMQQQWLVELKPGSFFPVQRVRDLGASQVARLGSSSNRFMFEGTVAIAELIATWEEVDLIQPYVVPMDPRFKLRMFPEDSGYGRDRYGPLHVPARGDTLYINAANWALYKDLVTRFENREAMLPPDTPVAQGRGVPYVVQQDYVFVMGDNRDSSIDSRAWGFVPRQHIVGRAQFLYFSWDDEMGSVRWDRLFEKVQ